MINSNITRLGFIQGFVFVATSLALASCAFAQSEEVSKPNIVLIIGDDISADDFGCYGHPNIRTPNIDKLASNGVRFTNAYLTTSQCSPTRCSVITGRYPHNTGAPNLHSPLPKGQILFPALLKEAGYYTGGSGKWHMGDYAKTAFHKVLGGYSWKTGGEEHWIPSLEQREKDKPFFMWLASSDAHRPFMPDKEAKPHTLEDAIIPPYLVDTPGVRKDMAQYYDEVSRMDRYVGLVVAELKRQNVYDNTCIIFMTDNGRPMVRCKTRLLDSGIKTPLIVHWPKGLKEKGTVCDSLVSVLDIAPMIVELAGLKSPDTFQGVSMAPLLNSPKKTIRKCVFAEHNWHAQTAHERMVRKGDYVYIRNSLPNQPAIFHKDSECPQKDLREWNKAGKLTPAQFDPLLSPRPAEELFNVKKDFHQLKTLVGNPEYLEVLKVMRALMDDWKERTGDTEPPKDLAKKRNKFVPGKAKNASKIKDSGPR